MSAPLGRRQSSRQVSKTSRPHNYYARNFSNSRTSIDNGGPSTQETQPGFFPAIEHFTNAVDALPKEVIRHFSMLKEVEAKLHGPDEQIRVLAKAITNLPEARKRAEPVQAYFPSLSAHNSVDGSRHGSVVGSTAGNTDETTEVADKERQSLFYNLSINIAMMAPALDEKIAVLSTANQTLQKHLDHMMSSYSHIPSEVSDEARLGNPKHWAYVTEKEPVKPPSGKESARRRDIQGANALAAAAAAIDARDGEFASRSEARREAVAARKSRQAMQVDSDFDDRPATKKGPGKAKKTIMEDPKSVGLGIANGIAGPSAGGKRKKVPGAVLMERSASGAMAQAMKGTLGTSGSARETPELGPKKRAKPGPPAKKRAPGGASPFLASSPIIGTFSAKEPPTRPGQARGRQNSAANSITSATLDNRNNTRPQSSQSNRQTNGGGPSTLSAYEQLQASAAAADNTTESLKPLPDQASKPLKSEDANDGEDLDMEDVDAPPAPPVVTRAGRTSKTATPLSSAFPEIGKRAGGGKSNKDSNTASHASSESGEQSRSKRKTAKSTPAVGSATTSIHPDEDVDDDPEEDAEELGEEEDVEEGNEPKYCYCNDVSYGEMVACDNDECPMEWFHLKCAGLSRAPDENTKWYCDQCKESMKGGKNGKGRPVSRRE